MKSRQLWHWAGRIVWGVLAAICLWFLLTANTIMRFVWAGIGLVFMLALAIGWERRYSFIPPSIHDVHHAEWERWK